MKNKIIIKSFDVSDLEAIKRVQVAMTGGKVSKDNGIDCYCFVTTFNDGIKVSCRATKKGTQVFSVWKND
jgi:hypothetical protein